MSRECSEIRELLSPYIDNQVSPQAREVVDAHIAECDACAEELATLRATVGLLRRVPRAAVPRSFALEEPARRPFPLFSVLRVGSALAAAVFVVLLGVDVLRAGIIPVGSSRLSAPPPAAGALSAERAEAPQDTTKSSKSFATNSQASPQAAQAPSASPSASAQAARGVASAPAAPASAPQPAVPAVGEQGSTANQQDTALKQTDSAVQPSPSTAPDRAPTSPVEPTTQTSPMPATSILRIGELTALVVALLAAAGAIWLRRGRAHR